jgi:hypothetical protein
LTTLEIVHASALDIPHEYIREQGVDTMIVDPPYSPYVHANTTSIGTGGRGARKNELGFGSLSPELFTWLVQAPAYVRTWSLIYSDIESAHTFRSVGHYLRSTVATIEPSDLGDASGYTGSLPWVRWSQPQLSGDRPPSGAEMVTVLWGYQGGKKSWNGPGGLVRFEAKALRGEGKHKTEKPLDLLLDQVCYFSNPGELVLDPCCGSGTTGQACRILGRRFVGVEKDQEWAEKADARLAAPLSERDRERVHRWVERVQAEASGVPAPTGEHDIRTWERAQRRLADVERARAWL